MKCPNCGLPESWPHTMCLEVTPELARRFARDNWAAKMAGTDEAWRELGSHTWSVGRKPS